ncbi:MAG: High-affinity branched-chain amino acid transport system permease protein LivH [Parcubacteria group bacterium ADurb.Bin316]|nr:MAG: High-affinity branched-chain amino acid transport system permease protein LivH [Parcubacteria group bacterium ADurb.Bin316]HQA64117.1 branched-chain amino acid ABC transporter permease [bacterium]
MAYLIHLAILFAIYAILGMSLNLVVGYTGLLSITHAAFYGIGAYTTAILLTKTGAGFFTSLILGIFITIAVSFLVGIVLSKFKGDYYSIGTLGFNTIVFAIFLNWQNLTRGPLGIPGISRPKLFGINFDNNFVFLILALVFLILVYFVSRFIVNSSFGRVLKAIREDETAIAVFGYNTLYFKLIIFIISAVIAATAGSLFASYITFVDPSGFQLMESVFILAIIILGGLANLRGPILGALFLTLLPEILRFVGFPADIAAQMRQVIYGVILVLLMLYRPQGLVGEYKL